MTKTRASYMAEYNPTWEAFILHCFTPEAAQDKIIDSVTDTYYRLTLSGVLKRNDAIPSVERLSKHLGVSKFSVSRAYERLRDQGVIASATRKGTWFVSAEAPFRERLADVLLVGRRVGFSYEEVEKHTLAELAALKKLLKTRKHL